MQPRWEATVSFIGDHSSGLQVAGLRGSSSLAADVGRPMRVGFGRTVVQTPAPAVWESGLLASPLSAVATGIHQAVYLRSP